MTALRLRWWRLCWWAAKRSHAAAIRDERWRDARRLWAWVNECEAVVADLAEARHRRMA